LGRQESHILESKTFATGSDMPIPQAHKRSMLEALLSVVTAIKPGEGLTAVLMTVNIFMLLAAYYVLKPVREVYVTPDWANTGTAIMAVLLIPIVKAYGIVARKVARKKLISYVTGFFISNLVIFFFLAEIQFRYMGVLFFVWVGIFNNMVIAQFWAYGNDIYSPERGKRLFPLIMLGSSIGAIVGPLVANEMGRLVGTNPLLLIAGAMLGLCIVLTVWIDNREKPAPAAGRERKPAEEALGREGGFELVWKHRYLLYIAVLIVLLNIVNTTGEQIRRQTFNESARASVTAQNPNLTDAPLKKAVDGVRLQLNSDFFFWVNLLSVLIQGLLVSRILKFLGIRGALLLVPIVVFLGYGVMAFLPSLLVVRTVKIVENSQDYSLMNTLRASLYLPTTRDMKYKAKQVIDTFFVRLGDLIASGIWFVGFDKLGLSIPGLARLMLGFVGVWLVLAIFIRREYGKMVPTENQVARAEG
jgi:AAA family ATP:ADP antiporter